MRRCPTTPAAADDEPAALCRAVLYLLPRVLADVKSAALANPENAFQRVQFITDSKNRTKSALRIDLVAEDSFAKHLRTFRKGRFKDINVFGEERKGSISTARSLCALLDVVDGTDLLERGFGNWCAAILFYDPNRPPGSRIPLAFIALAEPRVRIYHARCESNNAWVTEGKKTTEVRGPTSVRSLAEASICFYGQKPSRMARFAATPLLARLSSLPGKDVVSRIYTLAGNPMLARLVDHGAGSYRGIDAVLEVTGGQKPHDFVAGAFIAKKGGAALVAKDGSPISYEMLEDFLLQRDNVFEYIAAATSPLAGEIVQASRAPVSDSFSVYVRRIAAAFGAAQVAAETGLHGPAAVHAPISVAQPVRVVMLFSPHPDDESLTGAVALRLRQSGARVINVPITLGSRRERRLERLEELRAACDCLGFELALDEQLRNGAAHADPQWLKDLIAHEHPSVVVCPHDSDWHPTHSRAHDLTFEAVARSGDTNACLVIETEYWQPMSAPPPNLMIESSVDEVASLVTAVACHQGEVARNPYHLRLPAWMIDNVRRWELLAGAGQAVPSVVFATLYRVRGRVRGQWTHLLKAPLFIGSGEDLAAQLFRQFKL